MPANPALDPLRTLDAPPAPDANSMANVTAGVQPAPDTTVAHTTGADLTDPAATDAAETDPARTGTAATGQPAGQPAARRPVAPLADLPGYRIVGEIARGGMGRVLAGRELALDREVAIKVLLPGIDAGRFVTESRITARLPHPNIPPVYALGTLADGSPFLAMKLIRGRTLEDELKARPDLQSDLPRLLQTFEQIAQAVGFAHARGVIHRDLKPANVMVGEFGEVQVMDWGLAREMRNADVGVRSEDSPSADVPPAPHSTPDTPHSNLTQAGAIMGTPAYMAPEQARGEPADARADVFALGGILTAILTGKAVFGGKTAARTIQLAASGDTADAVLRLTASAADPELVAVATACLHADRDARPADGRAVAELVKAYRHGVERRLRQAEAERAAAVVREGEQRKRRRTVQRAATAVAAVLLLGVAGTGVGFYQATQRADAERAARGEADRRLAQVKAGNELVLSLFTDIDYRQARAERRPLEAVLADRLTTLAGRVEGESVGDREQVADLQSRLALSLLNLGHPKAAVAIFRKARDTYEAELGADHQKALVSGNNIASGLMDLGENEAAVPLLERSYAGLRRAAGDDHPETLKALGNLALALQDAGRPADALEVHRETVRRRQAALGENDPMTLTARNNLATCLYTLGNPAEAAPLFEQVRAGRAATLGDDHPDTFGAAINRAACLRDGGRPADAAAVLEVVVRGQTRKLGADHPDTLSGANNLAYTYLQLGEAGKAVPLWEDTVARRRLALGGDHPDTLSAMRLLAVAYRQVGPADRLLAVREQVLDAELARSGSGPPQPQAQSALALLAEDARRAGAGARALAPAKRYADAARAAKPADAALGAELTLVGRCLLDAGELPAAEGYLREGLALRRKAQPDEWATFNTQSLLGEVLARRRKHAEAEPLLVGGYEGLKAREKALPAAAAARLPEALDRLVALYAATRKPDLARKYNGLRAQYPNELAPPPRRAKEK